VVYPIKIAGMGMYVPEKLLTNDDLSRIVETSDEWIRTRTGISERRISEDYETNSYITEQACRTAVEKAGKKPEDINMFMLGTFTPDMHTPATACTVQGNMGMTNAWCFDLNAACCGFLYGLEIARGILQNYPDYNILVCGSERISRVVDWEDRATCVLFGDGAGAFVVNRDESLPREVINITARSLGHLNHLITMPYGGTEVPLTPENITERKHFLAMEGSTVFKYAIKSMVEVCNDVLEDTGVDLGEVRWLVPHQANQRILDGVGKKLGIDPEKVYSNVARFGNISAASIPVAICELEETLERGDKLLLSAFGAGLTCAGGLIEW